jgi:hypothetical protein
MTSAVEARPVLIHSTPRMPQRDAAAPSHETRNRIALAAITLLVLLIAFWPAFEGGSGLMDEGMILVYPELIQHGKLPYRDFETFYGPANPALLAGTFTIFGTNIFVERTVGLAYRIAILLAVFTIALPRGKTLAAGCMFLTGCLLLGTGLPAYAWLGAMACALWSLWLAGGARSGPRCFLAGLLAGGALLFRVDVGPAIIISALPLLHGMTSSQRRLYFLGGALGLLPLAILTLVVGWEPIVSNLFLMPVIASNPGRRLPLLSSPPYLLGLFSAHVAAVVIAGAAGWVTLRSSRLQAGGALLLSVALFALGITHQATQRLDSLHFIFAAFLSLGILPLSLVVLWTHFRRRPSEKVEIWCAMLLVVTLLQTLAPQLTMMVKSAFAAGVQAKAGATFVELRGRSFPFFSPAVAATVEQMLKKLNALAKPGERLFVGPADLRRTNYNDTYLYHMLPQLTPATYFLEMNPFSANRSGSRLAADIATADWLVLNRAWDSWKEPNRSAELGPNAPNRVVQERFEPCGQFGGYLLFRRKG